MVDDRTDEMVSSAVFRAADMPNGGRSSKDNDVSQLPEDVVILSDTPSSSSSDSWSGGEDPEEEPLYADQDDAQSIFQPALSPAVTRLTSLKTPAAEKAAAMEKLPGSSYFSIPGASTSSKVGPSIITRRRAKTTVTAPSTTIRPTKDGLLKPGQPQPMRPPSPWLSRPKEPQALSNVLGQTRHRRSSSSGGAEALRKIREALPSMPSLNLPSNLNLFSNLTSPTFFSGTMTPKHQTTDGTVESRRSRVPSPFVPRTGTPSSGDSAADAPDRSSTPRLPSPKSNKPRLLRRSTSHESMLYHTLSRISSLGDDDRWGHVREQTNSRLKAITDSWDRPTFKLPSFLPSPLKKPSLFGSETSTEGVPSAVMASTGSLSKDGNLSELDRVLENLTGDIVIMGGYRGSVLRSTKTNRQVWVPVKVGLNIRKVNLEVGLSDEDEEKMEETIYSSGMLQNIGPVDISKRLFKRLRECENAKNGKLRVWDYGWDWRLSPHLLSRKLIAFLEKLPSNQAGQPPSEKGATVIAHSLGGLITRHVVNQRPELFAGVIFAGTPQRCINILGPFRNGDAVLLNEKVLTAQVNFSLRTSFVFLPEDGYCFINKQTGEEYPIDFYNKAEWVKYALSPCVAPVSPAYNSRPSAFESLRNFSGSLPNLPLRSRGNSAPSEPQLVRSIRQAAVDAVRRMEVSHDRTLATQIGNQQQLNNATLSSSSSELTIKNNSQYMEYLGRTLANTKRFRAEMAHNPQLTESNSYPPLAVIYGKDIPTVYAVHVNSRDAIPCSDCYDDLLFRSGDGVVLAREAMLPEGYNVIKGGHVSTDRGHITMLGDLTAVGRALDAIVKGRRKGIGLGTANRLGEMAS